MAPKRADTFNIDRIGPLSATDAKQHLTNIKGKGRGTQNAVASKRNPQPPLQQVPPAEADLTPEQPRNRTAIETH